MINQFADVLQFLGFVKKACYHYATFGTDFDIFFNFSVVSIFSYWSNVHVSE